ncbi:MAG: MerR family transcriptional regulator [Candidatus Aminicenantales bacterium]
MKAFHANFIFASGTGSLEARTILMKRGNTPEKLVYKLEEVSRIACLDPQVIDSWEKEFPFLNAGKTASGSKIFREKDLKIILRVKELLEKKSYTLAGAKRKIEEEFGMKPSEDIHPDRLKKTLLMIREQLEEISLLLRKDRKKF